MHWRHVSITTTPCWGSRRVALRARVVLAGVLALSASPSVRGMARRGWPAGCMLGDGARGSASFDPQHAGGPFCDVICIWSITFVSHSRVALSVHAGFAAIAIFSASWPSGCGRGRDGNYACIVVSSCGWLAASTAASVTRKHSEVICLNQGPVVRVAMDMLVTPAEVTSDFYSVLVHTFMEGQVWAFSFHTLYWKFTLV